MSDYLDQLVTMDAVRGEARFWREKAQKYDAELAVARTLLGRALDDFQYEVSSDDPTISDIRAFLEAKQ